MAVVVVVILVVVLLMMLVVMTTVLLVFCVARGVCVWISGFVGGRMSARR